MPEPAREEAVVEKCAAVVGGVGNERVVMRKGVVFV